MIIKVGNVFIDFQELTIDDARLVIFLDQWDIDGNMIGLQRRRFKAVTVLKSVSKELTRLVQDVTIEGLT